MKFKIYSQILLFFVIITNVFAQGNPDSSPKPTVGNYEEVFDPYGKACVMITGHLPAGSCLEKVDEKGGLTYYILLPHCHQRFWESADLLEYALDVKFKPAEGYKVTKEVTDDEYKLPKMGGLNTIPEALSKQVGCFTVELQKDAKNYEQREKDGYGKATIRVVIQTPTILLTAHAPEVFGTLGARADRPATAEEDVFGMGDDQKDFGYLAFLRMHEGVGEVADGAEAPDPTANNPVGKDITAIKLELKKPEGFVFGEEIIRLRVPGRTLFYDRKGVLKEHAYWITGKKLNDKKDDALGDLTEEGEVIIYCEALQATPAEGESEAFDCGDCVLEIVGGALRETKSPVLLFPAEVIELAPLLTDEADVAVVGSGQPDPRPRATAMVERDPLAETPITNANAVRIAWREVRVKISEKLAGETVSWSMEELHIPGIALGGPNPNNLQPGFVGRWGTAVNADHRSRFSESQNFDGHDFDSDDPVNETQAQLIPGTPAANIPIDQTATTIIDDDGFTAIRVNVPPYGFNRARITIEVKGVSIDLIDLEVPGIIVIDAGHGSGNAVVNGSNPGGTTARNSGTAEHTVTRDIGNSLVAAMRTNFETEHHFKVFASRAGATNVGFSARTQVARDQGADILVSLHFNDPGDTAVRRDPNVLNRRHPFYIVDNTNNVNRAEDIRLGTDVRVAVQAAILAAESPAGRDAATDNITVAQHEANNNRLNVDGKDILTDADEVNFRNDPARRYTVTGLGNEVGYHPCRAAIIELEWFSNAAADSLFNRTNGQNINGIPGRSAEIRTELLRVIPGALIGNIQNHQ